MDRHVWLHAPEPPMRGPAFDTAIPPMRLPGYDWFSPMRPLGGDSWPMPPCCPHPDSIEPLAPPEPESEPDESVAVAALRADELAGVRTELSRIDTKAALLGTGVVSGLAWGAGALKHDSAIAVAVFGWGAETIAAAAGIVLLLAVRPRLRGKHGFLAWSGHPLTSWVRLERLASNETAHQQERHAELTELAGLVKRKYRLLRLAVDLLLVAAVLAAITVVVDIATQP